MGLMSIFFGGKKVEVRENLKKPLVWAIFILALAASFAAGYLLGQDEVRTPIVIEQRVQ